jgi:FkbM family methyltransferase
MKIQVATPIHHQGETSFWLSLIKCIQAGVIQDFSLVAGDSAVSRSRNNLTAKFLASKYDALLWIDSDIEFDAWHIERLKEHNLPIVAGLYPLKRKELAWCINLPKNGPVESTDVLQEVKYAGTGFMLIQRSVFEKMAKAFPDLIYREDDKTGNMIYNFWRMEVGLDTDLGYNRWLSEDWWFCEMWRRLGGKVFVDKRVTVRHHGPTAYPFDDKALVPVPNTSVDMACPETMRAHVQKVMDGEYDVPQLSDSVATVLDIGANVGGFSLWASRRWPNARIMAYEPAKENVKLWAENCKHLNGATLTTAAVSESTGPARLFHGKHNCGECGLRDLGEQNLDAFEEVQTVSPHSLPTADFVKIDTEGCELEIVRGMDLSKTKGMALEWHSDNDRLQIVDILGRRGFKVVEDKEVQPHRGIIKAVRETVLTE